MSDNISLSNNHQNWLKMSGDRPLSYALVCVCVCVCVRTLLCVCYTVYVGIAHLYCMHANF